MEYIMDKMTLIMSKSLNVHTCLCMCAYISVGLCSMSVHAESVSFHIL